MFNFDLLNEAVFDTELTDKEFRLLYVIANNAAKNNTNTVQLHNGWLMDKLNCCERQIRRLTNGLNQKGYVIKTVADISKNKNANTYTLERTLQADKNVPLKTSVNLPKIEDKPINDAIDCAVSNKNAINNAINVDKNVPLKTKVLKNEDKPQYDDKNVDKNVPLKNNIKIKENNNNLSTIELKDLGPKVTEDKKENKKEKVNEMKNAVLNEMERKDKEIITSTSSNETNNSNLQIDNKSDRNNSSALADDELFNEIFGVTSTGSENKAAGDVETRSMKQLPTSEDKNAPEDLKTQNNAYTLQDWMTEYQKLILQVENTDVEAVQFDTLLDEGCNLFENFPINEGNYKRQMQDLRLWVAKKVNYQKTIKISERWNKYYRAA